MIHCWDNTMRDKDKDKLEIVEKVGIRFAHTIYNMISNICKSLEASNKFDQS